MIVQEPLRREATGFRSRSIRMSETGLKVEVSLGNHVFRRTIPGA